MRIAAWFAICFAALVLAACSSGSDAPTNVDLAYLDGEGFVWLAGSASGEKQRLGDRAQCRGANNLSWSSRGDRIACFWPENGEVRIVDEAGGIVSQLEEASNFDWSPTGENFSYTSGADSRLHIADANGKEAGAVEIRIDSTGRWRPALWVDDGTAVLYSDISGHIFFYDVQSEEQRDPAVWGSYDSWSIAGDTLVVIELASSGKELVAQVYDIKTRGWQLARRQTLPIGYGNGSLSRDGAKLAVQAGNEVDVFDLRSGSMERRNRFKLCDCEAPSGIVFGPDSDFVYWEGRPENSESGRALYRSRTDGSDRQKVVELASPYAAVSNDLARVAYMEGEASSLKQLFVVDIASGRTRRIAEAAVVFGWRAPS